VTREQGEWEWDEAKDVENQRNHGLSFTALERVDLSDALIERDWRDYGEDRFRLMAWLDHRLCVVIFTPRGARMRAISFRMADARERRHYEETPT
jgi:uncharacterized DUF497 family protein